MEAQGAEKTAEKQQEGVIGKPFVKGQSGNPAGRPKGTKNFTTAFEEAIKRLASQEKIETSDIEIIVSAIKQARDGKYPFIKDLLDRLYGKPKESLDVDMKGEAVHKWEVVIVDGTKGSAGDTGDTGIQRHI